VPLEESKSDAARSANIATERRAGKPAKQAEAIAYSVQRKAANGAVEIDHDGIPLIGGKRVHPTDLDDQTFATYAKTLMGHVAAAAHGAVSDDPEPEDPPAGAPSGYSNEPGSDHGQPEDFPAPNGRQATPYAHAPQVSPAQLASNRADVSKAADGEVSATDLPTPAAEQSYSDTAGQLDPSGTQGTDQQFAQSQKDLQASMDGPSDDQVKQAAAKLQAGPDVDEQEAAAQVPVEHAGQGYDMDAPDERLKQAAEQMRAQMEGPSDDALATARAGVADHVAAEQKRATDYDTDPWSAFDAESKAIKDHFAPLYAAARALPGPGQPAGATPKGGDADAYKAYAYKQAKAAGLDPSIAMGVIEHESGWDPTIVGDGGHAVGLGQFHKAAATEQGLMDAQGNDYRTDPYKSIDAVISKLKKDGVTTDPDRALLKYNGGGDPNYIQNVQKAGSKYGGGYKGIPGMIASMGLGATAAPQGDAAAEDQMTAGPASDSSASPASSPGDQASGILAPPPPAKPWVEGSPDLDNATSEELDNAAKGAQAASDAGEQQTMEMPEQTVTAPTQAPAAPQAPGPTPPAAPDALSGLSSQLSGAANAIGSATQGEAVAAMEKAAAQGAQGHLQAALGRQAVSDMQGAYDQFQKDQAAGVAQASQLMQNYRDSMQRLSQTRINPNQYWSTMNAGQKFGSMLGVLISGFSGNPNDNMAMDVIQKNISRDIEAQKANYGIQKDVADSNRSLFDENMGVFREQQSAAVASQAMLWKQAAQRLESAAAQAQAPIDAANGMMLANQAYQRGAALEAGIQGTLVDNQTKSAELGLKIRQANIMQSFLGGAGGMGAAQKNPEQYNVMAGAFNAPMRAVTKIPSFAPPEFLGRTMTPDTAKKVSDAAPQYDEIHRSIQSLIDLRNQKNAILPEMLPLWNTKNRNLAEAAESRAETALASLKSQGISSRNEDHFHKTLGDAGSMSFTGSTDQNLKDLQDENSREYFGLWPQTRK
jgi:hypothetical protein